MKQRFLPMGIMLLATCVSCIASAQTKLSVQPVVDGAIDLPQLTLSYSDGVRLYQALHDSMSQLDLTLSELKKNNTSLSDLVPQAIFWQGAALYDTTKTEALISTQQSAIASLSSLATDPSTQESIAALSDYLNQPIVGERQFIPLDYDTVRINAKLNPMLNGQFTLVLPTRPLTVTVVGAVEQMQKVAFKARASASEYIEIAKANHFADNSFAYVVQPDGVVQRHATAYWNDNHQDIAPGAIIFVGFTGVFSEYQDLNDKILMLLKNRVQG